MAEPAQTQVIMDWIRTIGWDDRQEAGFPLYPGQEILTAPDQALFITGGGGPGYTTEEPATDGSVFQARVRGQSDDPLGVEQAAQLLDTLILRASYPAAVDGVTIVHVHRESNGPTPLPFDPRDRRFEFACSYIIVTGV
jgi:hypothetical protein